MVAVIRFIKKEIVLVVASLLAIISCFIVTPDRKYVDYIDFRTLAILFGLMAVVAGFQKLGIFHLLAGELLKRTKKMWQVVMVLVMLCFFLGMVITNDVALITFVPFSFTVLDMIGKETTKKWIAPVVCMQTLGANMGSMLTPLGNPQNLYLYGKSGMSFGQFVLVILPYSAIAMLLLVVWIIVRCHRLEKNTRLAISFSKNEKIDGVRFGVYTVLFMVCLASVVRILDYKIALVIVLVGMMVSDAKILKKVDYSLLVTFTALFIFIGNMGRIEAFSKLIERIIKGHEVITSIVVSQVTSNVPAALLLAGFTDRYDRLIVGVNIGGLGTLIASMASLISFKILANEMPKKKGEYFLWFTFSGLAFLAVLYPMTRVLGL